MTDNGHKACMLTSRHLAFDDRIFLRESVALARSGYKVTLIVPHKCDEIVDDVQIVAVSRPTTQLSKIFGTVWRIYREALRQDADVYHFHDPDLIPVGLALRARGKRVIYDAHEDLPADLSERTWVPRMLRRPVSMITRQTEMFAVKRLSGVITAGERIAERLAGSGTPTEVVRNFARAEEFGAATSNKARYESQMVVSFGGLNSRRSAVEIVKALALIPESVKIKLTLGGAAEPGVLHEVERLPGWKRVNFVGSVPRSEMVEYLNQAALALVLYSPAGNHMGVRSNRLFESMASGLPVITSNFPQWRELVENERCGVTVDPVDPSAIASALGRLVSNPQMCAEMGKHARELFVARYSWAVEQTRLLGLYTKVLKSRP